MTNMTDTSAEAVKRLAEFHFDRASFGYAYGGTGSTQYWDALMKERANQTAATLHALLAERDALQERAKAAKWVYQRMARSAEHENARAKHAEAERDRLQAEVASLRITLGGKTFGPDVPEPIGCPMPGACAQVAEIKRLRKDNANIRATVTEGWDQARKRQDQVRLLEAERDRLREALQWMVDNDDTNEGDEPMTEYGGRSWNDINAYWIDGLNRARAALKETGHD